MPQKGTLMSTVNYLRVISEALARNMKQQREQRSMKAIEKATEIAREAYEVYIILVPTNLHRLQLALALMSPLEVHSAVDYSPPFYCSSRYK